MAWESALGEWAANYLLTQKVKFIPKIISMYFNIVWCLVNIIMDKINIKHISTWVAFNDVDIPVSQ